MSLQSQGVTRTAYCTIQNVSIKYTTGKSQANNGHKVVNLQNLDTMHQFVHLKMNRINLP